MPVTAGSSSKRSAVSKPTKPKLARKKEKSMSSTSLSTTEPAVEDPTKKPVFFWREYGNANGYLSQWYLSPFADPSKPEVVYQTAEQYMMYGKAMLFNDPETAALILETSDPKSQKFLGRAVRNFDEKVWLADREKIVEEGNYLKFKYGKAVGELPREGMDGEQGEGKEDVMREWLLQTGEREIVEASPMDRIWGVGFGEKNAEKSRGKWGLNLLGICLMRARERLRKEAEGLNGHGEEKGSEETDDGWEKIEKV